jgi:ABC-type cobalamin/Fe3+-siderophores transport system ATPase subunit
MGETGCGKTRLIKFMCALQQPPGVTVENMILMKVWFDIRGLEKNHWDKKLIFICTLYADDQDGVEQTLVKFKCQLKLN